LETTLGSKNIITLTKPIKILIKLRLYYNINVSIKLTLD